jgi:hypothetical protein
MSRRELIVVWVAAGVMFLMLLVPPWQVRQEVRSVTGQHIATNGGVEYGFLFAPPGPRQSTEVSFAAGQLVMQWAGAGLLLAAVIVTLRNGRALKR